MSSEAKDERYRWVVVSAGALIMAVAMGSIVNGMSAYVVPMQELYGWQRGEISLINVAGIIGLAFGGLVMGPLADRYGSRILILAGALVIGTCYAAAGFATELWQFYGLMFVAGLLGASAIYSPLLASVGHWFPVGAGLAIGIATAGQALGQGAVPFLSALLIQNVGVGNALAITGLIMLVTLVPLSLLFRAPPVSNSQQGMNASAGSADDYPSFNLVIPVLCVAVVLCCTCMSVPLMHLVPLVQDRGFPPEEASSVILAMLTVGIMGRVAFGKFADMVGALPAYMTATLWMTLMIYGFIHVTSLSGFYVYAMVYGFGYAGVMTGILTSVASLTHPSRRASAVGIVSLFGWAGHAIGGFLGGYLYDKTGDYALAYGIAATAGATNLVIVGLFYARIRGIGRPTVSA